MSMVDDGTGRDNDAVDEPGWEVDPDDESGAAVVAAVGRQIKTWREAAGLRAGELGSLLGYGEDLIYKVEGGSRIPRPEFMDAVDVAVGAGGKLAAMKPDIAEVRYPKKIRELAKLEAAAVEEVTLRRHLGGRMVWRRQLEHLLEVSELRHVEIQVMPTSRDEHAGMGGEMQVLKFKDGSAVGRSEGDFGSRPVSDPRHLRIVELRCGIIRAQALNPRESRVFIEQVLGET
ncbi:helix-turn-helix domain-containing protein [Streptomyces globisporus]|uniref:helix-turn-helix domain-containing protein n=1 Tax=Streptomyces globisporus TaxID=1908 RepID=UPI0036FF7700